ncbi:MAG: hypothetical protein PVJ62_00080 [Deltaproteobacteria bacterium]
MMKCPHCDGEIPTRECPECHEGVPLEGRFCCQCGAEMPRAQPTAEAGEDVADFSERILCSDGSCIGVINEKGICNECGKPYSGEAE